MPKSAEKFISDNGADVYDKVKLTSKEQTFEGIIMPNNNFSGEHIIILKLDNGYNIGISTDGTELNVLEKAQRKDKQKIKSKKDKNLEDITILGTGGTIASFVDYKTGAVSPAITAEQLVNSVSSLKEIANIEAEPLLSLASEDMEPKHWEEMAVKVEEIHSKKNHGIIVGHGTDTMGYSAAALSFQLTEMSNPVIFTGSQRSPDRPSSDAHLNLEGAAKAAMSDLGEVGIAMHETTDDVGIAIWRGTRTRKNHSSKRDAFTSLNDGPLAIINKDIEWKEKYKPTTEKTSIRPGFDDNIALVWAHPGLKSEDWENITSSKKGAIIAGTGLGHINSNLLNTIGKSAKDIPVAMSTQCLAGTTNLNVYTNGRKLIEKGVVETYDTLPETALVKMMWLTKHEPDKVNKLMSENLVGEISNTRKLI